MKCIQFGWAGLGSLRDELRRPVGRISAQFGHPAWRGASSVTLWRDDGSGLRIFTQMYDVGKGLEVGVLNFEPATSMMLDEQVVDLNGRFDGEVDASKLIITESGAAIESGLVLAGKDEIEIAAGAFPLTLALRGIEFALPAFEPEYAWERYKRSAF